MEEHLCQLDRVRIIYEKYCEKFANLPAPWVAYANFELTLEETERCKQILNIAQQMGVEGIPDAEDFVAAAV